MKLRDSPHRIMQMVFRDVAHMLTHNDNLTTSDGSNVLSEIRDRDSIIDEIRTWEQTERDRVANLMQESFTMFYNEVGRAKTRAPNRAHYEMLQELMMKVLIKKREEKESKYWEVRNLVNLKQGLPVSNIVETLEEAISTFKLPSLNMSNLSYKAAVKKRMVRHKSRNQNVQAKREQHHYDIVMNHRSKQRQTKSYRKYTYKLPRKGLQYDTENRELSVINKPVKNRKDLHSQVMDYRTAFEAFQSSKIIKQFELLKKKRIRLRKKSELIPHSNFKQANAELKADVSFITKRFTRYTRSEAMADTRVRILKLTAESFEVYRNGFMYLDDKDLKLHLLNILDLVYQRQRCNMTMDRANVVYYKNQQLQRTCGKRYPLDTIMLEYTLPYSIDHDSDERINLDSQHGRYNSYVHYREMNHTDEVKTYQDFIDTKDYQMKYIYTTKQSSENATEFLRDEVNFSKANSDINSSDDDISYSEKLLHTYLDKKQYHNRDLQLMRREYYKVYNELYDELTEQREEEEKYERVNDDSEDFEEEYHLIDDEDSEFEDEEYDLEELYAYEFAEYDEDEEFDDSEEDNNEDSYDYEDDDNNGDEEDDEYEESDEDSENELEDELDSRLHDPEGDFNYDNEESELELWESNVRVYEYWMGSNEEDFDEEDDEYEEDNEYGWVDNPYNEIEYLEDSDDDDKENEDDYLNDLVKEREDLELELEPDFFPYPNLNVFKNGIRGSYDLIESSGMRTFKQVHYEENVLQEVLELDVGTWNDSLYLNSNVLKDSPIKINTDSVKVTLIKLDQYVKQGLLRSNYQPYPFVDVIAKPMKGFLEDVKITTIDERYKDVKEVNVLGVGYYTVELEYDPKSEREFSYESDEVGEQEDSVSLNQLVKSSLPSTLLKGFHLIPLKMKLVDNNNHVQLKEDSNNLSKPVRAMSMIELDHLYETTVLLKQSITFEESDAFKSRLFDKTNSYRKQQAYEKQMLEMQEDYEFTIKYPNEDDGGNAESEIILSQLLKEGGVAEQVPQFVYEHFRPPQEESEESIEEEEEDDDYED